MKRIKRKMKRGSGWGEDEEGKGLKNTATEGSQTLGGEHRA